MTSVSWNKVVPHILASASEDGTVVVWDLKNSQAIFNFKNPDLATYDYDPVTGKQEKKKTAHHIVWSPIAPTEFLLSNDNGDQSTLTLWDLRNPDYPRTLDCHNDGILATSWCPHDPKIIAASGRDGITSFLN